jgi:hypothetical protein
LHQISLLGDNRLTFLNFFILFYFFQINFIDFPFFQVADFSADNRSMQFGRWGDKHHHQQQQYQQSESRQNYPLAINDVPPMDWPMIDPEESALMDANLQRAMEIRWRD